MNSDDEQHADGRPLKRVAIFIDGSNLYHSLEENCKRYDVDFAAFAAKLCNGRSLFRVYYYNVLRVAEHNPQAYQDQQKFLSALHNTPYLEVRLGSSKVRGDVAVEKGVDIMVATDLLRLAWDNLYDVAILVSGDGDFAYAVQAVKNIGKHVEIAAFPANLSGDLVNVGRRSPATQSRVLLGPVEQEAGTAEGRVPRRWGFEAGLAARPLTQQRPRVACCAKKRPRTRRWPPGHPWCMTPGS